MTTPFNLQATVSNRVNNLVLHDATIYPLIYFFARNFFRDYSAWIIKKPNGVTDIYCTTAYSILNNIIPTGYISPIINLPGDLIIEMDKSGTYDITYIACPTLQTAASFFQYRTDDVVYYNNKIYKSTATATYNPSNFVVVDPSEVYSTQASYLFLGDIDVCLRNKIDKAMCLIKEDANRTDMCEDIFQDVILTDNIVYQLTNVVTPTPEYTRTIKNMLAYLNQTCACSNC